MKYILGIDPGIEGGLALVSDDSSSYYAVRMPTDKRGKKRIIDLENVISWLSEYTWKIDLDSCYIELVHAMPGQGVTSMFNFGVGYGLLKGMLISKSIPFTEVRPQEWKAAVLANTSKDKEAAIDHCLDTYRSVSLIPPGCRKPHDGIADALCIAEYGVNKLSIITK